MKICNLEDRMALNKFYGVSVGPGDPELITVKAVKIIQNCPVIAVPRTKGFNTTAFDIASQAMDLSEKEIVYLDFPMCRDETALEENYQKHADTICRLLQDTDVAMLSLGDVSIYSTFAYIAERVKKEGFEVVAIAGVPSFCACAAALSSPLVEKNQALHVLSASDEELEEKIAMSGTKVIMKSGKNIKRVLELAEKQGILNKTSVVANCGLETQKAIRVVEDLNDDFGYFSTVIIRE